MAWTQADIDTLQGAIASGVRSVTFADGRRTEYQSLDHMLAAVEVIGKAVADVPAGRGARRLIIGRVGRY